MRIQASEYQTVSVALKEIKTGSDRVAGIVTPVFVDMLLAAALRAQFHQDEDLLKKLLKPGGALGDFGVKIDLAFLVGIISDAAKKDLHRVRKIRNAFAHDALLDSFDKSPVRDWAMALTIPDWYRLEGVSEPPGGAGPTAVRVPSDGDTANASTPRGRFNVACKCLFTALAMAELRPPADPQF